MTVRRLLIAQTRANLPRMLATGLAIAIGAAFVVITFGLVASSERAVLNAVAAQFSSSAAVVTASPRAGETVSDRGAALIDARASLHGGARVGDVVVDRGGTAEIGRAGSSTTQTVSFQAITPAGPLRWERLVRGRLPTRPNEVAVSGPSGLSVGDRITAARVVYGDLSAGGTPSRAAALKVVGVIDLGADPHGGVGARIYVTGSQAVRLGAAVDQLRVAAPAGGSAGATLDAVRRRLSSVPSTSRLHVRSGDHVAHLLADSYAGSTSGATAALLVFVVIALVVAGLVIANTFAVVLAQRVGELALLRCVGAGPRQIRRLVLGEALVLGVVASLVGAAIGAALTVLVSTVLGHRVTTVPLGAVVVPVRGLVLAVVLGTATTMIAVAFPARAATRVRPLAALRPLEAPSAATRGGRTRLAVGTTLGTASLIGLVAASGSRQLGSAVLCGVVSFLALVLLAQQLAPVAVGAVGRLLAPLGGTAAAIAAGNVGRNPRRVAACVTALLIGITLTAAMVVGSTSTKATSSAQVAANHPIDITVAGDHLPPRLSGALAEVPGVAAVAEVRTAPVRIGGIADDALAVDHRQAARASRSTTDLPLPVPGQVVVDLRLADRLGVADGSRVTVAGDRGRRTLSVVVGTVEGQHLLLDVADLTATTGRAGISREWVRLADGSEADATDATVGAITRTSVARAADATVTASVAERRSLDSILDTLLVVVSGLLAISIAIALLGVGNTLALSVVERRRESGLLRALGFTRRQLAATLVWESLFLSLTTAAGGAAIGVGYGLLGVRAVLGELHAELAWPGLALVVAVSTLAGTAASLLPARRMARGSVTDALASGG